MSSHDNKFTIADLQKWVEEGLISPEQGTSIRSYIEPSPFFLVCLTGET